MSQLCHDTPDGQQPRLSLVSAPAQKPFKVVSHGIARAYPNRLVSLLREAGAGLTLERAGEGSFKSRGRHGFELPTRAFPELQALAQSGFSMYPVAGLPGVIKGLAPELNTLVIGLPEEADEAMCKALGLVLRRVLPEQPQVVAVDHLLAYRGLQTELPDADIRLLDAAEVMAELVQSSARVPVLVVPSELAPIFASAAIGLNGSQALACKIEAGRNRLWFTHETTHTTPVEPAAMVLALGWLLIAMGKPGVAGCLHNAVLKTLEDGVHTDALSLLNPYATQVGDTAMLDAITGRVGQKPARLPAVDYGTQRSRVPGRANLTCVS